MSKRPQLGVRVGQQGAHFGVWAPFAKSVGVTGDFTNWSEAGTPLSLHDGGVWAGFIRGATVGQQYKFVITHGKKTFSRNDPRALQLTAAQDASVIVDPDFDWQGDDFQLPPPNQQVIYELHIGTFNRDDPATPGTFDSAVEKLDYLRDLGINVIEVMPVCATNMERWWGYEPTFLFAVEAAYGGRQAFKTFVREAHKRGIGVVVDVVYNHLTPMPNYDLWRFDGWSEPNKGGIYFYSDWRIETPWGPRPDYGRPEVRRYIVDNARMWLEDCHADGLRADAIFAIRNAKGWNDDPEHDIADGWHLLQEITKTVHQTKPAAISIAEDVACNSYITRPTKNGGAGFTTQWETTFPATLRAAINPTEDQHRVLQPMADALCGRYNDDAFQRVVYSESHDADANGHARLNEEVAPDDPSGIYAQRRSMLAAAVALTAPGIPMLFQGQEFMEDGWFTHWGALDWQGADTFRGTVQFYRDLIALRRNLHGHTAGLLGQGFETLHVHENDKLLAYRRFNTSGGPGDTVIILNFANTVREKYQLPLPRAGTWKVRLNSDWEGYSPDFTNLHTEDITTDENSHGFITIAPYAVLVLSQDPA